MSHAARIGPDSVLAVSGGARGITAQCAIQMARRYHCKFILLGRTVLADYVPEWAGNSTDEADLKGRFIRWQSGRGEKTTPLLAQKAVTELLAQREIAQTLQAIREAGGEVVYLSLDITDGAALKEGLEMAQAQIGQVTGLLHGAGNLADKLIEQKTAQDFDKVYNPKVKGLQNLLACLSPERLEQIILFSSVAGFYGNAGQVDYSLANEILNKTAYLLQHQYPKCRVLSVNWGPWDGGMVTPALKEYFARLNIAVIPLEAGAELLMDELDHTENAPVQLVVGGKLTRPAATIDTDLQIHRISRLLSLDLNPFLLDHVIGGKPVLPAICVINWMANACEQLYPGYSLYISENNRVFKGLVFENNIPARYTVELKEIAKNTEGIIFEGIISSIGENGKQQFHYGARVTLKRDMPKSPHLDSRPGLRDNGQPGQQFYADGTLFHGPSFQGVKRVLEISPQGVELECYLPALTEEAQGQFPVQNFNPYAVDVQLQGLLIWARHTYGAGSLPLKIQHVEQFRPLPFNKIYYASMQLQQQSETGLVADVMAFDAEGNVYNRISGSEVTISKQLNKLFVAAGSLPATSGV